MWWSLRRFSAVFRWNPETLLSLIYRSYEASAARMLMHVIRNNVLGTASHRDRCGYANLIPFHATLHSPKHVPEELSFVFTRQKEVGYEHTTISSMQRHRLGQAWAYTRERLVGVLSQ